MSILTTPERKKNGSTAKWNTPTTNGNHVHPSTPSTELSTVTSQRTPSKRLTKAEKLALREKARVAMTPPGHVDEEEEEMEYQKTPQSCSLSMAVAMKAATSPTVSSFPDSFWAPFLEQEDYDREQMRYLLQQSNEKRRRQPTEKEAEGKNTAARILDVSLDDSPNVSTLEEDVSVSKSITLVRVATPFLRSILRVCLYLSFGLFLLSCLDAPYLHRFLKTIALFGRLFLGLCFWLYDIISNQLRQANIMPQDLTKYFQNLNLPGLDDFSRYYDYLTTDGMDDFLDFLTDIQIKVNNLIDGFL